ncbi:hypothetical protein LX36DRAFT_655361 [Colletotrichum falcatum]|nr:hypothetical protein LX36DRAFT_655361 [Colletotrichum falcatum]
MSQALIEMSVSKVAYECPKFCTQPKGTDEEIKTLVESLLGHREFSRIFVFGSVLAFLVVGCRELWSRSLKRVA